MLLAEINLVRNDDTWVTDGDEYYFACAKEFDPLFHTEERSGITLLVYDSPEEDCTRIDICPLWYEDEDEEEDHTSEKPLGYNLFCGGNLLTSEGVYTKLRHRLHEIHDKGIKVVWCKVD